MMFSINVTARQTNNERVLTLPHKPLSNIGKFEHLIKQVEIDKMVDTER